MVRSIDLRKLSYFAQQTRPVKVLTAFGIKLIGAMSTTDQLKRDAEFGADSDEKRLRTDAAGDPADVLASSELDPNDYRNFRIKEENVGIVEFVSNNKGFKCELKQRFSDFIVHEIAADGQITEMTCTKAPSMSVEQETVQDAKIVDLIPNETLEKLAQLNEQAEVTDESVLIDVQEKDKSQRTMVHKYTARFLSLESRTEEIDGRKYIKVVKLQKAAYRRPKDNWPAGLPFYLHFNFYQENKGKF